MARRIVFLLVAMVLANGLAYAGDTPAPSNARVYIIWPPDGAVIDGGKLWVRMGLRDMSIAPAKVDKQNTGHHHLIVDAELPPFDEEIPSDNNYLHFGAGQSEARLNLPPGEHTLQLILGDHNHMPHNPPLYSRKITVVVP